MTSQTLFAAAIVAATALSPAIAAANDAGPGGKTGDRLAAFAGDPRPPQPMLDGGPARHGPGGDGPGFAERPLFARFDAPGLPPPPPPPMMGHGRHQPRPDDGERRHGPRPPPAAMAAMMLSAAETALGIRVDQLDAWRAFSSAVVAMLEPPPPPPRPGTSAEDETADPFARIEHLAAFVAERGRRAEAVEDAIDALRPVLTPEQTERLAEIEARLAAHRPFPPFAGRPPEFSSPMTGPGPADPEADAAPPPPPGD
jgi:hypothetical protein